MFTQFEGDMPKMQFNSYTEIFNLAPGFKLRNGQKRAFEFVTKTNQNIIFAVLPTGYGKTIVAYGIYAILRSMSIVDRMLVFVPQDEQREQFVNKAKEISLQLGVNFKRALTISVNPRDLIYNRKEKAEIFVASYQQIAWQRISSCDSLTCNKDHFKDLIKMGKWLIVHDEVHHLPEDGKWGPIVHELDRAFSLYLSATPVRNDNKLLIGIPILKTEDNKFFKYQADIEVSLKEAFNDEAIRGIEGHIEEYFIDVTSENGETSRIDTNFLRENNISDLNQYEIKRGLRFCSKYYSKMLLHALDKFEAKEAKYPGQNQMLVFCMSCKHAESVSKTFNEIIDDDSFSNWVGVSRPEKENKKIIKDFKANKFKCLVNIDKAGEGFDNKRCNTLVFLHLIQSDNKLTQQIGRGLRRNDAIPFEEDICDVFASSDTELAEFIRDLEEEIWGKIKEKKGPREGGNGSLPDLFFVDAEYIKTKYVKPGILLEDEQHQKILEDAKEAGFPPNINLDTYLKFLKLRSGGNQNYRSGSETISNDPYQSETDRIKYCSDQVKTGTKRLANKLVNISCCNGVFDKTLLGVAKKIINTEWIRISGNKHNAMTADDFIKKYKWLQDQFKTISTIKELPLWAKQLQQ